MIYLKDFRNDTEISKEFPWLIGFLPKHRNNGAVKLIDYREISKKVEVEGLSKEEEQEQYESYAFRERQLSGYKLLYDGEVQGTNIEVLYKLSKEDPNDVAYFGEYFHEYVVIIKEVGVRNIA